MSRIIPKLLIVEDEKNTREGIGRALKFDYHVELAENAERAISLLNEKRFDLILTDVKMPGMDGVTFVKEAKKLDPRLICIVMTAYGTVETAVDAMKAGAYDFLIKPVKLDQVEAVLKNAIDGKNRREQTAESKTPEKKVEKKASTKVFGKSKAIKKILSLVEQIAPARSTVLLTGESGTGKEVISNLIHECSDRANGPFVAVHCAALNANLLESELFGHEKGAFTGASGKKIGRFEAANGGTLFLDEIGEIDPSTQVKLLRVLETRSFERVGGSESIETDVRLIAATNRNLKSMVDEGTFREDLYYRLDVLNITLPPLRERHDDIPVLLNHFLEACAEDNNKSIKGFTDEALEKLKNYKWQGNVRELRNVVEKMTVLSRHDILDVDDIPPYILDTNPFPTQNEEDETLNVSDNETNLIIRALKESNNNKTAAAKKLGISRRTLHRRISELGLDSK
ncbi:MAG: sigma-54 dependent transcriptional regulator [Lentisphaeraceae bacterium]|nr:sigma-54 dependent transcriptional regulator [Lentisphaeraceae bacterium]